MLMADGYPKKTLKKPSRPHPCSMLRTPGMTIGQGQQGLDAMGQALTRILKKLDDELILTAQNWAQIYPNLIFMGLVSRKQMKTDQKPWSVSHVSHNLCLRLMKKWALGALGALAQADTRAVKKSVFVAKRCKVGTSAPSLQNRESISNRVGHGYQENLFIFLGIGTKMLLPFFSCKILWGSQISHAEDWTR